MHSHRSTIFHHFLPVLVVVFVIILGKEVVFVSFFLCVEERDLFFFCKVSSLNSKDKHLGGGGRDKNKTDVVHLIYLFGVLR